MRISSVLEYTGTYLRAALTEATPATLDGGKSRECSGLFHKILPTISIEIIRYRGEDLYRKVCELIVKL